MKAKSILVLTIAGAVTLTAGIYLYSIAGEINNLEIVIISLIVILAGISIYMGVRRLNQEKQGFPSDDELSLLLKYKGGYYAYLVSMYLWFFIFIFKDKFPDTETMLGVGILGSAIVYFITQQYVKREIDAKSH